jgi:hypothetical protein
MKVLALSSFGMLGRRAAWSAAEEPTLRAGVELQRLAALCARIATRHEHCPLKRRYQSPILLVGVGLDLDDAAVGL